MHILLTGGGTAGHVIPNIAIAAAIREFNPEARITYIGSRKGIERKLCEEAGIPFESVATGKLRRYIDLRNLTDIFRIPVGVLQAFFKLLRHRPKVVFSKGGYVGFPVVFAAWLIGIPVYIHESDAIPGLTTRLCAPYAKKIFLGYEEAAEELDHYATKLEVVGNPVRLDLYEGKAAAAKKWTGFSGKRPVLLVMGGSSGSMELNKKIEKEKAALTAVYDIVHITGEGKGTLSQNESSKSAPSKNYFAVPYIGDELKDLYALASLALTRAGANTLAELQALQLPALLFPLGTHASRGDQILNAESVCKNSHLYRLGEDVPPLTVQLAKLPVRPKTHVENSATQVIALTLLSDAK